jgi:hypothetical protein
MPAAAAAAGAGDVHTWHRPTACEAAVNPDAVVAADGHSLSNNPCTTAHPAERRASAATAAAAAWITSAAQTGGSNSGSRDILLSSATARKGYRLRPCRLVGGRRHTEHTDTHGVLAAGSAASQAVSRRVHARMLLLLLVVSAAENYMVSWAAYLLLSTWFVSVKRVTGGTSAISTWQSTGNLASYLSGQLRMWWLHLFYRTALNCDHHHMILSYDNDWRRYHRSSRWNFCLHLLEGESHLHCLAISTLQQSWRASWRQDDVDLHGWLWSSNWTINICRYVASLSQACSPTEKQNQALF